MIHEEICTYEVCKFAKEKGFNVPTRTVKVEKIKATEKEVWDEEECRYITQWETRSLRIPTQSLLQRWLREEKGVVIEVIAYPTCSNNKKNCYWWSIKKNSDGICYQYEECSDILYGFGFAFDTYELALEDALKYALKNLV
jgi:hypothetical protein